MTKLVSLVEMDVVIYIFDQGSKQGIVEISVKTFYSLYIGNLHVLFNKTNLINVFLLLFLTSFSNFSNFINFY